MASVKTSRYQEDIKRVLPQILRGVKDPRVQGLVTIVRVDLTNDLSLCRVYVSSLEGIEKATETVIGLNAAAGFIRRELGLLAPMRRSPQLIFYPDDSVEKSVETFKKLDELK